MSLQIHFSTGKDNWGTPRDLFDYWHSIFHFTVDAAADASNHLLPRWYGPGGERESALDGPWAVEERYWLNPPYSRGAQKLFIAKAHDVAIRGGLVVALLPARPDTLAFHTYVWDRANAIPRPNVRVHFLKGRVRFVGAAAGAPFPSMIVVFGNPQEESTT
jgi:site-specific DNA-methyltransferase (adenine-specific)